MYKEMEKPGGTGDIHSFTVFFFSRDGTGVVHKSENHKEDGGLVGWMDGWI